MTTDALLDEQLRPAFDLRDLGLAQADAATAVDERDRVDAVIAGWAARRVEFSANDLRPQVEGVRASLLAPRLEAARKAGLIGLVEGKSVPSTLRSTRGHRLSVWIGVP